MCCSQLVVHLHSKVINLLLPFINILSQCFGILPVAGLAGAINLGQRTLHVVVGVFNAAFLHIRHVAIGATQPALPVNTLLKKFVTWMLRF